MRAIETKEYETRMKSQDWKDKRDHFFDWCRWNNRLHCWFCGEKDISLLRAHHTYYGNFGNERKEDLACLCVRCHTHMHNVLRKEFSFIPKERKINFLSFLLLGIKEEFRQIGKGIIPALIAQKKRKY
jgi:hypothetical protein